MKADTRRNSISVWIILRQLVQCLCTYTSYKENNKWLNKGRTKLLSKTNSPIIVCFRTLSLIARFIISCDIHDHDQCHHYKHITYTVIIFIMLIHDYIKIYKVWAITEVSFGRHVIIRNLHNPALFHILTYIPQTACNYLSIVDWLSAQRLTC